MSLSKETFARPYIPLHLQHLPHKRFVTASGFEIFPMWSGEEIGRASCRERVSVCV